jgi:phage tail-like protein
MTPKPDYPAIGYRFDLKIDGLDLGTFTKVEGLVAKYETKPVTEGGENGFVHTLRGRLTYENVKLTRPIDKQTKDVMTWFVKLADGKPGKRGGGVITAIGANNTAVARWRLSGVYPVRYQGPSFDAGGSAVPTESLELGHEGFAVG